MIRLVYARASHILVLAQRHLAPTNDGRASARVSYPSTDLRIPESRILRAGLG